MNNVLSKKFIPNLTIMEFLDESKMFIQEYSCPLCEGILFESVIDKCGHSFCKECLLKLLKETTQCPYTKHEISSTLSQNIIVNSVIEKQKVYCKNKVRECPWIGKLSERRAHIANDCQKEIVNCLFTPNCSVKLTREELDNHLSVCPFRLIDCQYCNAKISFKDNENHNKVCPNIPVDCSNKCGMKVPLNKVTYHIDVECDNTVTECPFGLVGCEFYDIRKQLKLHLNVDLERHLKLISMKMSLLQNKIDEQNTMINTLTQDNNNTKNELDYIRQSISGSHDELANQLSMIQMQINTNMMYITIPITNFIPNFFEGVNGGDIFELNDELFNITKVKENYGWYGISSQYLIPISANANNTLNQSQMNMKESLMKSQKIDKSKMMMSQTMTKSKLGMALGMDNNPIMIINMKILSTKNSMIMFGITFSDNPSPMQNGYYHQTIESEQSYMFYCYNSSIYFKGIPITESKEQQCVDGDIITMIIDTIANTLVFRRNGEVVNDVISLPDLAKMKVRAALDLSQYGDSIIFLNR